MIMNSKRNGTSPKAQNEASTTDYKTIEMYKLQTKIQIIVIKKLSGLQENSDQEISVIEKIYKNPTERAGGMAQQLYSFFLFRFVAQWFSI